MMEGTAKTSAGHGLSLDSSVLMSLRDHVRQQLRLAIIAGRFAPGERLTERALAEELGVSTTPLKEALRNLEAEGLIEVLPRRGIAVRFDADYAEEMILARAALESSLAALAARRADDAQRQELAATIRLMEAATTAGDASQLILLNETFHDGIHAAARSRHLSRLVAQQQFYDDSARRVIHDKKEESRLAFEEHAAIGAAILAGDGKQAAEAMRGHVLRSGRLYLSLVFDRDWSEE